jgi:hypothetical protein
MSFTAPRGAQALSEYPELPLHAFGVDHSTVTIAVDEEILVASLRNTKLTQRDISEILPYQGSSNAAEIEKVLTDMPGLSLGHTVTYVYLAVNHALSRIFRNRILVPRDNDDGDAEMALLFSRDPKSVDDSWRNLRDLVEIKAIKSQRLRVEVYFDRDKFQQTLTELRLHSAQAFWDPSKSRIGLFVDRSLFYWLPAQANWGDQSTDELVKHIRNYFVRRTLDTIGHELIHFVQQSGSNQLYSRPFVAEAAAVFVEENIFFREEMFQLASAHTQRNLPLLPAPGSRCRLLMEFSPPMSIRGILKAEHAITAALASDFDVERELMMRDGDYYSRSFDELRLSYELSYLFLLFVGTIPRDEFNRQFGPLIHNRSDDEVQAALKGVSKSFRTWMREFSQRWWNAKDASETYEAASGLVTECLNARNFTMAHSGARMMAAYKPHSVTPIIYAGDVFWRVIIPFFAFDHYALALSRSKASVGADEVEARTTSRMGDAYEILGDLPTAVEMFKRSWQKSSVVVSNAGTLIIVLRSKLKAEFYKRMLQADLRQSPVSLMLMNFYVGLLQGGECGDAAEKARANSIGQAMQQGNWQEFERKYREHYDLIAAKMVGEIASGDHRQLLSAIRARCT